MTTIFSKVPHWFNTIFLQLWLSISSVSFYQRVILSYNGYGVKYILTLSFASSLLCSIYMLHYIDNIRQYFSYGIISQAVVNLDHILSQFPELKYDGTKISLEQSEPIYINNIYTYRMTVFTEIITANLPFVLISSTGAVYQSSFGAGYSVGADRRIDLV